MSNDGNRMNGVFSDILATSDLEELTEFCSYFMWEKKYSLRNCLLIYAQRPGAVMLHTARQWASLYKREVKPGVSPIVILTPNGPVSFIYDYNDTYGGIEIPNLTRCTSALHDVEIPEDYVIDVVDAVKRNGIACEFANTGTRQGGQLAALNKPMTYTIEISPIKSVTISTDILITLNSKKSPTDQFTALLHELGHLYCGHISRGKYTPKNLKFPDRRNLPKNQKEYEAEKTMQTVCNLLGLKPKVEDYLFGYRNEDGTEPEVDMEQIFGAAEQIMGLLRGM